MSEAPAPLIPLRGLRSTAPARRVVVLGRQGSGKGTQSAALARRLGIPHISAGEALRRAVRSGSLLGGAVEEAMTTGRLVDDGLVAAAIWDRVEKSPGFVLDGFPRTVEQGRLLETMVGGMALDAAIHIDVPVETVVSRLGRRRVCISCGLDYPGPQPDGECARCGSLVERRSDDTASAIRARLALYDRHEPALCAWLRSRTRLHSVDGTGTPEEVAHRVWAALRAHPSTHPMHLRTVAGDPAPV